MTKVVLNFSMSLDGYVAGPDIGMDLPMGAGGERLHDWLFAPTRNDIDRQVEQETTAAAGAVVVGRRTFDLGLGHWGDTPFPAPSFVLTHEVRGPLPQKSGTFVFVNDGIEAALRAAEGAVEDGDVFVMGADTARQALAAGRVDEINLQLVPILLGGGPRLFDGIDVDGAGFELIRALQSPHAMHLRYRIVK